MKMNYTYKFIVYNPINTDEFTYVTYTNDKVVTSSKLLSNSKRDEYGNILLEVPNNYNFNDFIRILQNYINFVEYSNMTNNNNYEINISLILFLYYLQNEEYMKKYMRIINKNSEMYANIIKILNNNYYDYDFHKYSLYKNLPRGWITNIDYYNEWVNNIIIETYKDGNYTWYLFPETTYVDEKYNIKTKNDKNYIQYLWYIYSSMDNIDDFLYEYKNIDKSIFNNVKSVTYNENDIILINIIRNVFQKTIIITLNENEDSTFGKINLQYINDSLHAYRLYQNSLPSHIYYIGEKVQSIEYTKGFVDNMLKCKNIKYKNNGYDIHIDFIFNKYMRINIKVMYDKLYIVYEFDNKNRISKILFYDNSIRHEYKYTYNNDIPKITYIGSGNANNDIITNITIDDILEKYTDFNYEQLIEFANKFDLSFTDINSDKAIF